MDDDKFFVFDDVLTKKEHENLFKSIKMLKWTNMWSSVLGSERESGPWHWNHTFFEARQNMPAMTIEQLAEMDKLYPDLTALYAKIMDLSKKYVGKCDILRLYSNCNPYGTNAYVHQDDGDYTAIYYPCTEWESEWEGGTCFYERDENKRLDAIRYVSYKPNRMVIFTGRIPHRGMPVDRRCILPRYVIASKLQRDVNDSDYAKEFFNAK
jgi:hypothetical protein